MKRRRNKLHRGSWLSRLFKKQPKHSLSHEDISPSLKRGSDAAWELPKHESKEELPPAKEIRPPDIETPRTGIEALPEKHLRPPWYVRMFAPRRRKRRKIYKQPTPLFIKPIDPEPPRNRFQMSRVVMVIMNSTIMYLMAFLIIYFVYQMIVIFTANSFGISGVLYYYQVFWPIGDSSPLWFPHYKIILITGSGPFISLILGLIFFRVFVPRLKNPQTKLFFLWLALHALNMFFGAFVAGVITSDGFGYVPLWLGLHVGLRIFFSMIFLFGLASFGYHFTRYFLETAPSPSLLKSERRRQFLLYHVLIPSILGALVIILVRIPFNPPYQIIVLATMLAATITAVFNHKAKPDRIKSFPKHHDRKLHLGYLVVLALLMIGFRYGLALGLHFIINFRFSVSIFGATP